MGLCCCGDGDGMRGGPAEARRYGGMVSEGDGRKGDKLRDRFISDPLATLGNVYKPMPRKVMPNLLNHGAWGRREGKDTLTLNVSKAFEVGDTRVLRVDLRYLAPKVQRPLVGIRAKLRWSSDWGRWEDKDTLTLNVSRVFERVDLRYLASKVRRLLAGIRAELRWSSDWGRREGNDTLTLNVSRVFEIRE
ncbi:hypothetical protein PIB30_047223 [Stylosanthes scabra]|uniref:Uncharacterized protein n=1 Tax=Stylosanthes scabra TaxID=79078 RepID=A0ABU6WGQ3_9FABA|nr:hypothetical protein [Stylosanthes scabra]